MIVKNEFVSWASLRFRLRRSRFTLNASPLHISDHADAYDRFAKEARL